MSKRARSASSTSRDFRIENKVYADVGKRMFLNEDFADLHFLFDEEGENVCNRIPAHKAILAAGSDVFAIMLNGEWLETNEVRIVDVSADAFKEFLQFFYLSEVNISTENVSEVFYLADKYNVRECMTLCEPNVVQHTASKNLCKVLDLALQFDLKILKDHCLNNICTNETTEILATEAFLGCSKDALRTILSVDAISCEEIDLFNACINWAIHQCETNDTQSDDANIRKELGDCLYLIRFGAMESEKISECISKYKELFSHAELRDIWLTKGTDKSQVEIFKKFTPRKDLRLWDDSLSFRCELTSEVFQFARRRLSAVEATTFRISKSLLFGGISVNILTHSVGNSNSSVFGNSPKIACRLFVFELSNLDSAPNPAAPSFSNKTELLQETIRLDVKNASQFSVEMEETLKFESIRLQANRYYEIRIEKEREHSNKVFYSGTIIGALQQKQFGDGVTMHTQTCSPFIRSLHFNL